MNPDPISTWLYPLRSVLDPAGQVDWRSLTMTADALDDALVDHPVGPELVAGAERSRRLRAVRVAMAGCRDVDPANQPALFQVLVQFLCGYRDIDLRDATGLGHGRLIARYGSAPTRNRWLPRLLAGELAGIAMTEPHGGSRPAATRTRAVARSDGTWLISGRKTWISRLTEAAVFIVFFRAPDGTLAAAAVDSDEPNLRRHLVAPAGLAGWAWGMLDLDAVPMRPEDVLHGDGMAILREHFAVYRPLVTATALGAAAAVFDTVTSGLGERLASGEVPRLRDSALVTVGRTHAQLTTALLGVVIASHLADTAHENAEHWGAAMKAHGIDTANQTAAELALLLGASGFRDDCQIAKTRRDLNGLLYADGIHDSLYRTSGKHHTDVDKASVPVPRVAAPNLPIPA
jgi:alkylation response protein AidB-like acyl-CoA dehydrogenase